MVAASAFSLIGAAAIVGALFLGHQSDKHGRRGWLSFSYNLRSVGFLVVLLSMGISFLGIPPLGLPALMVGIVLVGFSWNATVSITAAYASDRFGRHQAGNHLRHHVRRHALGGRPRRVPGWAVLRCQGTYDIALRSNVVLLSVVTVLVFLIRERIPASGQPALAH